MLDNVNSIIISTAYKRAIINNNNPIIIIIHTIRGWPTTGRYIGPSPVLLAITTDSSSLVKLSSPLVFGYLDDISLGGPTSIVAEDCMLLEKECSTLGLTLNRSKCEIITKTVNCSTKTLSKTLHVPIQTLQHSWEHRCPQALPWIKH